MLVSERKPGDGWRGGVGSSRVGAIVEMGCGAQ